MATYPTRTPGPLGSLEDRVATLEAQLRRVTSPTAEQYAQAVSSLPLVQTTAGSALGIGLSSLASGQWFEYVTMPLPAIPAGKTSLDGIAIATAAFDDASSNGVAFVNMRLRIAYPSGAEEFSGIFPGSKQFGSYANTNSITGAFRISQVGLKEGDYVTVGIQVNASSPSAFPAAPNNNIQGSVIASAANLR